MEVTQFTYFQQVGGIEVDPVPVEITYGLERIAMLRVLIPSMTWFGATCQTALNDIRPGIHENEREALNLQL